VLGVMGRESVVITALDDLLHGRNRVRAIASGQMYAERATTIGHSCPTFSPDSKRIAFVRYMVVGGNVTGNLFVMNIDGSGARQLTNVARNQCVDHPSFSPDGTRIAFHVATSKHELLNLQHIVLPIGQAYVCNVFTIDLGSGQIRQITNNGLSREPAWGR
jgi:Tol biopolymer transport system component